MSLINQRVVYLNGVYVPENEAVVPIKDQGFKYGDGVCLLYTSPSPRDATLSRMPSSA